MVVDQKPHSFSPNILAIFWSGLLDALYRPNGWVEMHFRLNVGIASKCGPMTIDPTLSL
jgi:hypothetical protein